MTTLFKHRWNRMAVRMAGGSFALGTLLFLIALMAENPLIETLGLVFLVLYIPVTIIVCFLLFVNTLMHFRDLHEHVMTFLLVLLNFPMALVYIHFLNP